MIVTDGKNIMTLTELAQRICNSYDEDGCDKCPANEYCHNGHSGMLYWLRKVVQE